MNESGAQTDFESKIATISNKLKNSIRLILVERGGEDSSEITRFNNDFTSAQKRIEMLIERLNKPDFDWANKLVADEDKVPQKLKNVPQFFDQGFTLNNFYQRFYGNGRIIPNLLDEEFISNKKTFAEHYLIRFIRQKPDMFRKVAELVNTVMSVDRLLAERHAGFFDVVKNNYPSAYEDYLGVLRDAHSQMSHYVSRNDPGIDSYTLVG